MMDKTIDFSTLYEKFYENYDKKGFFNCHPGSPKSPYTIMMPPPNVTGTLHLGHALTFTLQDILTRFHRMKGFDVLWQPGTDHAGIATQMVVERMLAAQNISRGDLGREKFLERVWEWKEESGSTIVNQLKQLGATADWRRERFTMDEGLSDAVRKVFVQLYNEGLIYRDKKLVNWDCKLLTAVSDLEVEEKEQKGKMWHLKYPLVEDASSYIVVATTRPETFFGDMAVAVHPEDDRYKHLIGKKVTLPIINRQVPIVADEYCDMEKGTGAVKITPAHDFNDFDVGQRHNLELLSVMDIHGHMNENAPAEFQGMERFEARKKVVQMFEEMELLEKIEDITHKVPYGDRSGTILEPRMTDQWFVDAKVLAEPAIKAVEEGKTKFVPENWSNVYFEWLRNIRPWCISRQIWWGHRIPAWYGPDGHVFVAESEHDAQKLAKEHYGHKEALTQDNDVLDTWFSSALWPFSTLGWPEQTPELSRYYPSSVLVTGFDIIFFWVARMMMMGLHFMKDVPFKTVYVHALVRDEKGQKMSKSKGNVIDPMELMNKFGTDAVRFTLAALAAPGRDVKMSESRVEGYRNFGTKLWNASRFAQMNHCKLMPLFQPDECTLSINLWMGQEIKDLEKKVTQAIQEYKFNEAAHYLYHGVWGAFCDWYLELVKPILTSDNLKLVHETRTMIAWSIRQFLTMLNPFMPFLTEEIWQHFCPDEKLSALMAHSWPRYEFEIADTVRDEIQYVIDLISNIRRVRTELNVPASAKIESIMLSSNIFGQKVVNEYKDTIERMARIELKDHSSSNKGDVQLIIRETKLSLNLGNVIDFAEERIRLQKEIDKHTKEKAAIEGRLNNPSYCEKAPAEVVTESKQRHHELGILIQHLNEYLVLMGE